jgi:NADH dehydrogenase/NADH:ubiquinone oxidoreductase subunit G
MKTISFFLNGAKLSVPAGTTVLEAAIEYGDCIPHLCHMKGILPMGACRLCIVEVVKGKSSKVTASCTLEAKEGLHVVTHTEKLLKARRITAELLVAEAPNSRAIQDMAVKCGVTSVRMPFRHETCIMCGKCVRVCDEMWQSKSLGFTGRGADRHVAMPFNTRPDTCKRCWTCTDVCPMNITPCAGPMETGKEYLCGKCSSVLSMSEKFPDGCVQCRLGEGFDCERMRPNA